MATPAKKTAKKKKKKKKTAKKNKLARKRGEKLSAVDLKRVQRAEEMFDDGLVLFRSRKYDQALERWHGAMEYDPYNTKVLSGLGSLLTLINRGEDARRLFGIAAELEPEVGDHRFNLGQCWLEEGHYKNALTCLLQARQLDPRNGMIHLTIGRTLLASGERDEAVNCLEYTFEKHKQTPGAGLMLGDIAHDEGRPDDARSWYEQEIERFPNEPGAYKNLGIVFMEHSNTKEAIDLLEVAAKLDEGDKESRQLIERLRAL